LASISYLLMRQIYYVNKKKRTRKRQGVIKSFPFLCVCLMSLSLCVCVVYHPVNLSEPLLQYSSDRDVGCSVILAALDIDDDDFGGSIV